MAIFDGMDTELLIVGQGICGTFMSWWLERAGVPHIVIDEMRPHTASRAAAGLINPVTGRRIVTTWMIDELLPFAFRAYGGMAEAVGSSFLKPVSVIDFFPTAQMRVAFVERCREDPSYLGLPGDEHDWDASFRYGLGYGMIAPCYLVDVVGLLGAARRRMLQRGGLLEERFEREELVVGGGSIRYKDIRANRIIFCDGIESSMSPYFSRLPFAPNKGEALIVEVPGLAGAAGAGAMAEAAAEKGRKGASREAGGSAETVFKKGISLVPWKDNLYWAGSSYEWSFTDDGPTEAFRKRTEAILQDWLKLPFKIVDHFASVRPATLERRPFVGFHPLYREIGILNGMGTKGCSLAPYFAHQLVQHITEGRPLQGDVDVRRFSKVLSRK